MAINPAELQFSAFSLLTPLGQQRDAVYRTLVAGLSAYGASPLINAAGQNMTFAAVPDACLPQPLPSLAALSERQRRIVQLVAGPLADTASACPGDQPLPMVWVLPEKIPPFRTPVDDRFIPLFAAQAGVIADEQHSYMLPLGRAGLVEGLRTAAELLEQTPAPAVLLGAVDSFWDTDYLQHLDERERVLAPGVGDGFAPGEAAACVLVSREALAGDLGLRCAGWGQSREPGHRYSDEAHIGEQLAAAVMNALDGRPPGRIGLGLSSLNGESFWAKEWSIACHRARSYCRDNLRVEHPAVGLGDLGAASGLVTLGLAAGFLQDAPELGEALIGLASELEPRAALILKPGGD